MKKVIKENKYLLTSGETEIGRGSSIQSLCDLINASMSWVYAQKNKNINNDGTWSFVHKGYNYTIYEIQDYSKFNRKKIKLLLEKRREKLKQLSYEIENYYK